ncbi:MAG: tetratricopeptide repeat protein [Blastocatellia bacterium]
MLQTAEVRPLIIGVAVERELKGGQSHHYQMTAEAGQFVRIVVTQKGINVVVRVSSPDGKPLWEVDVAGQTEGIEEVSLIAEQAGNYRIEIAPVDKDAGAGRYEAVLTDLRAATQPEQKRWEAEKLSNEAAGLIDQGTKDSFAAAVTKLESAVALNHAAGYQVGEIITLLMLSNVHQNLSEYQKALDRLSQALLLARAAGERRYEATILNNLGTVYALLGQPQQRLEVLKQALPLVRTAGDRVTEAVLLSNLGNAAHNLSDFQQALDYFAQALPLLQAAGEQRFVAITLNNIGAAYRNLGEATKALEYYQQALPLLRADGDKVNEAVTLDNIGVLYRSLDDAPKALEYFNQALSLRRATGNKRGEAVTLDNLGSTWRMMGDASKAAEYHQQALELFQSIGERYKAAITLDNLGVAYRELGKSGQALDSHRQALQLLKETGDRLAEARALRNIAHLEREAGKLAEAQNHIEEAISRIEFVRAGVRNQETRSSFFATVADFYEFRTDLLMQRHQAEPNAGHDQAALAASEQARARSLIELLGEARADIRAGIAPALLEHERSLRERLTARLDDLTRLLTGRHTEAQQKAAEKEISDLTDEYRQAQTEIRKNSPRYAALTQPQPLTLAEIQKQVLDDDTLLLEYAPGEKRSWLWVVSSSSISSYALPPRAEIEAAARKVYDRLIARPGKTGATDAQFSAQASALSRMLLPGPAVTQLGHKRLLIVAPGALAYLPFAALPDPSVVSRQLSVVRGQSSVAGRRATHTQQSAMDNGQRTTDSQPLIASHEIVSVPSASVLAVIRREIAGRAAAAKTVAVLADPVFESNDPRLALAVKKNSGNSLAQASKDEASVMTATLRRAVSGVNATRAGFARLPFSAEEAEAILSVAPSGAGLKATGFRANRTTATSTDLSQYRIVHFATHGLLNSAQPELSGLVFSLLDEQGRAQDGFLRLHEIFNLKLNADLIVLSACQTGLGKEIRGEGLVGLTRGFMYAGTPRVVASLWQVDDLATAELMKRFYRGMLKENLRPAAALRAAQLELSQQKRWAAPYYWAAFTLQGEWR